MDKTRAAHLLIAALLPAFAPHCAKAQARLTLEQAGSRTGNEFRPTYLNQQISVSGVVAAAMYQLEGSFLLPIQDEANHGLLLKGPREQFASMAPGDRLDVTGSVGVLVGMPVLNPSSIVRTGTVAPPAPLRLPVDSLRSFGPLGVLVTTESLVTRIQPNADVEFATIGDHGSSVHIYLAKDHRPSAGHNRPPRGLPP